MKSVNLSWKALRFIILAVEAEMRRLETSLPSLDEDASADAGNDLELYRAILQDLRDAEAS